ncbi:response regulator transcription factor [Parashewanella tropica]|uniref:response regulator transcription factor n=1 Tax=Parashewanella tropica TaxID=2547970 RepID=UPI0010599D79|nr:LuxR C-terminal-related transcriptional regulator [Parashewanella tropica]
MAKAGFAQALTERQEEILNLVSKGLTNNEIAQLLGLSVNTIKTHISTVFNSLGASNRAEAISIFQSMQQHYTGTELLKVDIHSTQPELYHLTNEIGQNLLQSQLFEVSVAKSGQAEYLIKLESSKDQVNISIHRPQDGTIIWQEHSHTLQTFPITPVSIELIQLMVGDCCKQALPQSDAHRYLNFYPCIHGFFSYSQKHRATNLTQIMTAIDEINDDATVYAIASLIEYRSLAEAPESSDAMAAFSRISFHAKTALGLNKHCTWSHLAMAVMHFIQKNIPASIEHAKQSIVLYKGNYTAQSFLAQMYALSNQPHKALEHLDEALKIYPALHWQGLMMSSKALVYFALKDFESCIQLCQKSTDFIEACLLTDLVWIVSLALTQQQEQLQQRIQQLPKFNNKEYQRLLSVLPGESISEFTRILKQLKVLPD